MALACEFAALSAARPTLPDQQGSNTATKGNQWVVTIHSPHDGDRPVDDGVLPEVRDEDVVADDERPVVLDDELDAPVEEQGRADAYPDYADGGDEAHEEG